MRRTIDVCLATTLLILFAPLLLLIVALMLVLSPGPVLYRQIRVGKHHKLFWIYKFRTMTPNTDIAGNGVTVAGDSRITPLGRVLRASKLDELPQLANVVKGDMSLVGPRPEVPAIVRTYTVDMLRVLNVRPGMTSNASLDLVGEEEIVAMAPDPELFYTEVVVPAKVRYSLQHIDRSSLAFDLGILAQTCWYVLLRPLGYRKEGRLTRHLLDLVRAPVVPEQPYTPPTQHAVGESAAP